MVKKYADLSHDLNSRQLRGAPMGGQLEDHGPAYGLVEVCGILTRSKLSSKWGPPSGAKKSQLHEEHTNKPMKKNDRSETSQNCSSGARARTLNMLPTAATALSAAQLAHVFEKYTYFLITLIVPH